LIFNDAMSALDVRAQDALFANLRRELRDRTLLLIDADSTRVKTLERAFELRNGKVVEHSAAVARESTPTTRTDEGSDDLSNTVGILAQIPLFAGMDRSQLKLLAFTSEPVAFEPEHVVFRQGAPGDNAYVILEGSAEVVLESASGETVVARLGRHQVFGEMALLTSSPRTTTIRAATALSMLAIRQDVFVRLVEENSQVSVGITRMLIERLAKTNADLNRARAESRG